MPKRKGRGRPKGSSLQKKVKSNANVETTVLDNAFNDLEIDPEFVEEQKKGTHGFTLSHSPVPVDPGFVEEQEIGTMFMRKGRGRPKGSSLQTKVKQGANVKSTVLDNSSNDLEVYPQFVEEQETGTMTRGKGRGRPKGSILQKNVKQSANVKTVLNNPSNEFEVDREFSGEQEPEMPTNRGRGRPKRSSDLNYQKSVQRNVSSSPINPANMVETVHEGKELENPDLQFYVLDNPSNESEVAPGFVEEWERDLPKKRGPGRPKRSRGQNYREDVPRIISNPFISSNTVQVVHDCIESESEDMPNEKGQEQPRESRVQNCHRNPNGTVVYDNPSNVMEVSPVCEEGPEAVFNTPMQRGRGRPKGSMNQMNHPQNADARVRPKKIVRGPTKGVMLEMKRKLSPDGKLDVIIHPERLVAIGPGRKDFITDLSIILRKNARFNVNKWRRVPQSTRDTIVEKILNHWRLPDTDMVRKAIIDEAGRLYRNWRNRLHEYYLMFETKEEALKHVPEDVNGPDWKFLVDYFSSPSFEMISTKNKACRAKQRTLHTSGRKSFQAISFDARDPTTGKEPDLQTLWQITHKRANGEWIDEASKEINDKVTEQVGEMLLENSQDGVEIVEPEIIKTAFKTVVGKKSYMQGFEEGLRSSSSGRVKRLQAELDAQRTETENAKKECNEIRAKLVEVESQLAEERRKREESEVRLVDRQKDMQEINIQVQTAIQSALSQYCPPKTEAATSSEHNEKVAELEAQLHEAEDVITDIRAELARYRRY
ncbi:uncharacterized protein LOC131603338 isoform X2 [Vicia villosa]|uniref:uncharacterized protein LOC131603338 isoform X2 n=1 Tax=Vicia villosa TaxID=3911 RepID=UPI00273BB93A|nr:uncharacterized protein LOC131603338 isoform X2 [Vicia villosa]